MLNASPNSISTLFSHDTRGVVLLDGGFVCATFQSRAIDINVITLVLGNNARGCLLERHHTSIVVGISSG